MLLPSPYVDSEASILKSYSAAPGSYSALSGPPPERSSFHYAIRRIHNRGENEMEIERFNPDGLFALDAFTQIVTANNVGRVAYIAGQGAFDANFDLVGPGDLHAQTVQAFRNLRTAVESLGGQVENIVSTTMYLVEITAEKVDIFAGAMAEALDGKPFPPNASSMIGVQGLAAEGMLVEISAVAVLP